jgi:phosphonate transport system substrate-binding protein
MHFQGNKIGLLLTFCLFFLLLAFSCSGPRHESVTVDFSTSTEEGDDYVGHDSLPVLRVAIATVISPRESFVYYKELFDYISQRLHLTVEFKQRMTYQEVNELLQQNLVDIAFVCSGAYVVGSENMELLVVPLHNGLPYYQGYIITQQNSAVTRFEDFRGKSFTYSDPLCFTGKLFIDGKLANMGLTSEEFFGNVLFSTSHDISIQMVSRNLVDGASVNGLIYDYLSYFQPEALQNIRLIEKSDYFGIPPIVNSLSLPRELRLEIQALFLDMHLHEDGRKIIKQLQVDKFILSGDTLYDGIREARKRLQK